jgi:UDP-N-acetylglucosamine acyltransferase
MVADRYAEARGINSEGLKRRGFDNERIAAIKRAYRTVFVSGKPLAEAKLELAQGGATSEDVRQMLAFIEASTRGLLR